MKIKIKHRNGSVIFAHDEDENTIKKTVLAAIKEGANLRGADLSGADLRGANLRGANLSGANLDFSCLTFSCKSLKAKTDERQRVQLMFHALSWIKNAENATEFELQILEFAKEYANKFHRSDVVRLWSAL